MSLVGPGRVGRVLARALSAAGYAVAGPTGRHDRIEPADVVLLCVPDAEIAAAADRARAAGRFIGHVSGATPVEASGVDFGLHPLNTFVGTEGPDALRGVGCAIGAASPEALEVARGLAVGLGARPFVIPDAGRAGYHAAASIASNFVVTLLGAAEDAAATAGLAPEDARALLAPLVRATVENWVAHGPEAALTGPIARGDLVTVQRQRAALESGAPHLLPLFDELCVSTLSLAQKDETPS
ncbi:DUF2520 domain-containing protein [Microbacterium thalassium]|uniref:Putative short-subunit dehydrogenase-like oxidoreductase (DUF2520 family) n=1 Tax=Microbacterium thalassium TaxID=362649 RepID=A0A7X0KT58_9MICO|nr:DUF2520 domain-containing protein [Microbacterium thalassium]MBB6389790.1 putative short-subunit dehydrogenase-like oxidoreductase (DUF2520 family) [Microbacterium thalassium]GLK24478.1 oxidoreductase [Microbacterium thalassium]